MTNPKQTAIITWQPTWTKPTVTGARETLGGYYVATMPELNLFATGGSHSTALDALMALVAAAPQDNNSAYGGIRHY